LFFLQATKYHGHQREVLKTGEKTSRKTFTSENQAANSLIHSPHTMTKGNADRNPTEATEPLVQIQTLVSKLTL
jgi:hypothetical protein